MIQQLGNYFLQPQNLAALALLLVLIILYLLKPKPEKKMMPSVMFFREDENPGKLKQGLRKILRNKFLFLHIALFSLIAISLAEPYVNQPSQSQERTIYLDATANTFENFENYRDYAQNNLAETNNVVVISNETRTYTDLTRAGANQVISEVEPTEERKNLETSLSAAETLEGDIYISSNLASLTSAEVNQHLGNIASEKSIDLIKDDFSNSWGITDYSLSEGKIQIYVKNYLSREANPVLSLNSESLKELELNSSGVNTFEVELEKGRNNITLSDDDFVIDNSLYVYHPQSRTINVEASEEHPYVREAVKAIPEAQLVNQDPDIVFKEHSEIGATDSSDIRNGMNLIYMTEAGNNQRPNFLPVKNLQRAQDDVFVKKPIQTSLYSAEYLQGNVVSDSDNLTTPSSAIVRQSIGKGTILQYNIIDTSFSQQLSFPIFWRNIFRDIAGVPTLRSSNIDTGQTKEDVSTSEQGYIRQGSTQYGLSTYGVFPSKNLQIDQQSSVSQEPRSISSVVNLLILLVLIIETLLLVRERVI